MKYKIWATDEAWLPEGPGENILAKVPKGGPSIVWPDSSKLMEVNVLEDCAKRCKRLNAEQREWWANFINREKRYREKWNNLGEEYLKNAEVHKWYLDKLQKHKPIKELRQIDLDQKEREGVMPNCCSKRQISPAKGIHVEHQFVVKLECPVHKKAILKPWQWAKEVCKKQKQKTARLVYNLHGNVLLVQRIYVCVKGRLCHKLMSATPDVMNTLPKILQEYFPFVLRGKSGYTKTLADFIEVQLKQGVNSLKISEGIASLAIREFSKELFAEANKDSRSDSYKIGMSQFYKNSLFSYPSNDTLMNMFLKSLKACSH